MKTPNPEVNSIAMMSPVAQEEMALERGERGREKENRFETTTDAPMMIMIQPIKSDETSRLPKISHPAPKPTRNPPKPRPLGLLISTMIQVRHLKINLSENKVVE